MARIPGKGAAVYVSDAENGTVFTKIGKVAETDLFELQTMSEEVTTLEDAYEQHEPTMSALGDMSFEIIIDTSDATHDVATGVMALAVAKAKRTFRFVTSNGKKFEYKQFINNLKWGKATQKGILRAQVNLKHYSDPVAICTNA